MAQEPIEMLVVVSKVKKTIKAKHGLSTSAETCDKLSQLIAETIDAAAANAKSDGRKTLMARDVESLDISVKPQ